MITEYVIYTNENKFAEEYSEPKNLGFVEIIEAEDVEEAKRIILDRNEGDSPHSYDGEELIIIARNNISKLDMRYR